MTNYKQTNRKAKLKNIDPKRLKKHSQIATVRESEVVVAGPRIRTDTGYIIKGFFGEKLETFYEMYMQGTTSHVLRHPTKDRVARVHSGAGFVIIYSEESVVIEKQLFPGDEIVLKSGTAYRFATTSNQPLSLYISQESKYSARLEVVQETDTRVKVPDSMLVEPSRVSRVSPRRSTSKAREQQAELAKHRITSGQVIQPQVQNSNDDSNKPAPVSEIMNARPSMGRFSEASAG